MSWYIVRSDQKVCDDIPQKAPVSNLVHGKIQPITNMENQNLNSNPGRPELLSGSVMATLCGMKVAWNLTVLED